MNRSELIKMMANGERISSKTSEKVIYLFINAIKIALSKGEKVTISGFGTFSIAQRKARKGRNPKTGEVITISEKKVPRFKPSESLRQAVE
ncbi:MAG: HU family DNA-binding protein [Nitrospinae bacterium]|nr:HU family DNA-binding protein [Nitrospinota bacterium]